MTLSDIPKEEYSRSGILIHQRALYDNQPTHEERDLKKSLEARVTSLVLTIQCFGGLARNIQDTLWQGDRSRAWRTFEQQIGSVATKLEQLNDFACKKEKNVMKGAPKRSGRGQQANKDPFFHGVSREIDSLESRLHKILMRLSQETISSLVDAPTKPQDPINRLFRFRDGIFPP